MSALYPDILVDTSISEETIFPGMQHNESGPGVVRKKNQNRRCNIMNQDQVWLRTRCCSQKEPKSPLQHNESGPGVVRKKSQNRRWGGKIVPPIKGFPLIPPRILQDDGHAKGFQGSCRAVKHCNFSSGSETIRTQGYGDSHKKGTSK